MKHWGLFLFALAFAACHDDNQPEPAYYITPEISGLAADYPGVQQHIAISANCDWNIGDTPEWCIAQKITADDKDYLAVEIMPNDEENPRETFIMLSYGQTVIPFHVTQKGEKMPAPMQWYTFPTNWFSDVTYDSPDNDETWRYRITGFELSVSPSSRNQVFPGNLIDRHATNRELTDYADKYTFNPIILTASTYDTKHFTKPSLEQTNKWVKELIAKSPEQSSDFFYRSPIRYTSYRQLHLLGIGNMGLKLDELISGDSYLDKEMEKRTGMIYTYSHELIRIFVGEYPEHLIAETVSDEERHEMSYINGVAYGRTALLLIESDRKYQETKNVVSKIMWEESLNAEELQIRDNLAAYYIYFNDKGDVQTEKGGNELIGKFWSGIGSLNILPVNFTTNQFEDHAVGTMEVTFDLP